jgi:hypothetical protein
MPAITVSEFGAKCDGRTDDFESISRAVSAARSRHINVIVQPSAEPCMLSRFVAVPDGVRLEAKPGSAVFMATAHNVSTPALLEVGSDVQVVGLTFDGQAYAIDNAAPLIQGFKVSGVTFDRIVVQHARGSGLVLSTSVSSSQVMNSSFIDIGNHWRISGRREDRKPGLVFCCGQANRYNAALNDTFNDIGLDALQFSDQQDFKAVGNRFELSSGQTERLSSPDYPAALFLLRDEGGLVADNHIHGAQGNCIDAPGAKNVTIRNNVIDRCGGIGIGLFSTDTYGPPMTMPEGDTITANVIGNFAETSWIRQHNCHAISSPAGASGISVTSNKINGSPPC